MIVYGDTEETIEYNDSTMDYSNEAMILLSKYGYENCGDARIKVK